MKRLRFDELVLMSQPERRARRLALHPTSTVIKGDNDTGKSSIVKSLYWALGAEPPVVHPKWQQAEVITSLKFSVDDVSYRVVRSGTRFSFFDSADELIDSFTNVSSEVASYIANLFDFRLQLPAQSSGATTQATPAFLFLPFYIDQDAGWQNNWLGSFARLKQFRSSNLNRDVLHFHFGIRPSEYYSAKIALTEILAEISELRRERAVLVNLLEDLQEELKAADFSLNLDDFRDEVAQLLERANRLREEEDSLRGRMSVAYRALASVRDQITIARHALAELQADRSFASKLEDESVRCPTCHAEYSNGFAERFAIAVDEDQCMALLSELDEHERQAHVAYASAQGLTAEAQEKVGRVEELLQSRREELVLQDLLRSEGRREMLGVLNRQVSELDERMGGLDARESAARDRMKKYEDRKRSTTIQDYFRSEVSRLLQQLDVRNLSRDSYKTLGSHIKETGSDLSRAVLAFGLASIRTIEKYSECASCPFVVDSPRQQDQDDQSWELIRDAIRDERPADCQLVLAVADDGGTDFGGDVITLDRKREVLASDEFDEVAGEIRPLLQTALLADGREHE